MTESQSRRVGWVIVVLLLLSGVAVSLLIDLGDWDVRLSAGFHDSGPVGNGWPTGKQSPWAEFYRFGEYPAIIMAVVAFILYLLTRVNRFPSRYAKPLLVIVLTVILGPGLVVNGIMKPFWGRPRPADTVTFGGEYQYRGVFSPAGPDNGKSFVSGHCANAFSIASGVALFPYSPGLAGLFLGVGLALGAFGGFARIVQGAHFLSDTLWSGVIVFSIIAWLYFCLFKIPARIDDDADDGSGRT